MYIKKLHVQNIKCFSDLSLDFTRNKNEVRLWTALLGNNGVGKSLILQCIALVLAGGSASTELLPYPKHWVRWNEEKGSIEATVSLTEHDPGYPRKDLDLKYWIVGEKGSKIDGKFVDGPRIYEDNSNDNEIFRKVMSSKKGCLVCAYGPFRRISKDDERIQSNKSGSNPRSARLTTLFYDGAIPSDLSGWLSQLEYASIKTKKKVDELRYEKATKILDEILPGYTFAEITSDRKVWFTTYDGRIRVPLTELSDGYKSVISWSSDLMMQMFESSKELSDEPLTGKGVVIIDEIDIHLHPQGQRKVISWLKEHFPNIQFIISSHSPFVAQPLNHDEILILTRGENETQIEPLDEDLVGWSVDEVLTSKAFGLETTHDEETENLLSDYKKLLASKHSYKSLDEYTKNYEILKAKLQKRLPPSNNMVTLLEYKHELEELIEKKRNKSKTKTK